jgi:hypothetical protein
MITDYFGILTQTITDYFDVLTQMITDYFEVLTQMITDCYDDLTIQYSIMKRKFRQIPPISTK